METNVNKTLYPLIRDYMSAMGTSRTTLTALKSYMDAIRRLKCTESAFWPLLMELNKVIRKAEPTVVPLVHLIEEFEVELQVHLNKGLEFAKTKAIEILNHKLKRFEADTQKVTEQCMAMIAPGDFIVVHSPTAYIANALVQAHTEFKRPFQVLILKQDFHRTKDLVDALTEHQVPHLLIPEHNLSHYLGDAHKLFISAVTITLDGKAITGLGTANVVSICHAYKVPVYLFVESMKFSHKPLKGQNIFKEESNRTEKDYDFRITAFSHDYVDLALVDHIITEKGETIQEKQNE
jgi:translation initiation factor 2B subunit (eIF-2B alpha/beta/delta family)